MEFASRKSVMTPSATQSLSSSNIRRNQAHLLHDFQNQPSEDSFFTKSYSRDTPLRKNPKVIDSAPVVFVVQGIREGSGASSATASIAWHLSRRHSVLAVCTPASSQGFRLIFNLPTNDQLDCTFWRYTNSLNLYTPTHSGTFSESNVKKLLALFSSAGVHYVVLDAGSCGDPEAATWCEVADLIVTVMEPDADALLRLSERVPDANEVFLLNKVQASSRAAADVQRHLRSLKSLADRITPPLVPFDEFTARASLRRGPVAQLNPEAQSARAFCALGTWLLLRADRLRQEAAC